MNIIGIDLGTTNSLVTVWKDGEAVLVPNSFGSHLTPSVISISKKGEVVVGDIAKEKLITEPANTVSSVKRFMGTNKRYRIGNEDYSPQALSALILKQLIKDAEIYLGEPVTEAVISVPAYFNDNQRAATKAAGKIAGVHVERIINEPSSVGLAYQMMLGRDGDFLVFDLGGGTLDVSVVETFENIVEIVSIAGDNHLGGDDFNIEIANYFYAQHEGLEEKLNDSERASVLKLAEDCKRKLTEHDTAQLLYTYNKTSYEVEYTNELLLSICVSLFVRIKDVIKQALRDSKKNINQIDKIILVGGSSKMPIVEMYLEHLMGRTPIQIIDPDQAVAIGVGMVAGIKSRNETIKDMVLADICPFTLGIKVVNETYRRDLNYSAIIERNTSLPVTSKRYYTNVVDYQKNMKIEIYQGESLKAENNLRLGEVVIDIDPCLKGKNEIEVQFSYDINGILEVVVTDMVIGHSESQRIVQNEKLSDDEIEYYMNRLNTLAISPRDKDRNKLVIAKAERLYMESSGELREIIESKLKTFLRVIDNNNIIEIEKNRQDLLTFLENISQYEYGLFDEDK